jgi:hypothetical protein
LGAFFGAIVVPGFVPFVQQGGFSTSASFANSGNAATQDITENAPLRKGQLACNLNTTSLGFHSSFFAFASFFVAAFICFSNLAF